MFAFELVGLIVVLICYNPIISIATYLILVLFDIFKICRKIKEERILILQLEAELKSLRTK